MSELAAMGPHSTGGPGPPEQESDVSDHNYTSCQEPMCQRCEDHSAGYRDGKSKCAVRGLDPDH